MDRQEIEIELESLKSFRLGIGDVDRYQKELDGYNTRFKLLDIEMKKYRYIATDGKETGCEVIEDEWYTLKHDRDRLVGLINSCESMFEKYNRAKYLSDLLNELNERLRRKNLKENKKAYIHSGKPGDQLKLF